MQLNDKLQDLMLDGQDVKRNQQQMNDKLKDLVGNESEDEEVDVLFYFKLRTCQMT